MKRKRVSKMPVSPSIAAREEALERFRTLLSEGNYQRLLQELDKPLRQAIRVNPLKAASMSTQVAAWSQRYRWQSEAVPFCDSGWFVSVAAGGTPVSKTIEHRLGYYYVQDAASMLPPRENLYKHLKQGADLVLFSGGKGLRGPQSSGLILGRKDLVEACAFHACPNAYLGRPMKVGKEELVGLMTAVRSYLDQDHEALMQRYEDQVRYTIEALGALPHITARRSFPSEAGQPVPRAEIILDEDALGQTRDELSAQLRAGKPSIALSAAGTSGIYLNPQTLVPGQERVIVERIQEILSA